VVDCTHPYWGQSVQCRQGNQPQASHRLSRVNHRPGSLRLTSLGVTGVVGVTVTVNVGSTASTVNLWVRPLGLGSLTGS